MTIRAPEPTERAPLRPKLSVVIPVYNSGVLEELTARLETVLSREGGPYEIIFVDDFSPNPDVWPTLERLAQERSSVKSIQLTRNFGQQPATLCGLREAQGDVVITMDDDLQHSPEDIPKLRSVEAADIVIGHFTRKRHSLFRRTTSRMKGVFDRIILGKPKGIQLSSFRLLHRTVVEGVLAIRTPNPFLPALMFHISKNVESVELAHHPRTEGRTGYTIPKLIALFSNLVINNSSLVLRFVGQLGMLCAAGSLLMAGIIAFRKIAYGAAIQGWTSLMATQLLIGGFLLFGVGAVGEYLIRIIETTEDRPSYFVRQRIDGQDRDG